MNTQVGGGGGSFMQQMSAMAASREREHDSVNAQRMSSVLGSAGAAAVDQHAHVQVDQNDVTFISDEFEIERSEAETILKRSAGSLPAALASLVSAP